MTVNVILEKTPSNWCAYTPDDIGVVLATAATRRAVVERFRKALRQHIKAMEFEGLDTPVVEALNIQELVAV